MRDILFRAKSKFGRHEWLYGSLLKLNGRAYTCPDKSDVWNMNMYEIIDETIGQYSGLKDKNGVKIYEGDILQDKYLDDEGIEQISYFEVIYKNGCFGIDTSYPRKRLDCEPILKYFQPEELEISGNIHDNKELIKEE